MLDLAPFAERAQDQHGHHAHAAGGDQRADEHADAERQPALALALQLHEGEADQTAGETADDDGGEGGEPCRGGGERRQRPARVGEVGGSHVPNLRRRVVIVALVAE